jgi:hypothetical protein
MPTEFPPGRGGRESNNDEPAPGGPGRVKSRPMKIASIFARGATAALLLAAATACAGNLPASKNAPPVGAKAPDFTLPDLAGRPITLSRLLASPVDEASGRKGAWVLLVFYRGYW